MILSNSPHKYKRFDFLLFICCIAFFLLFPKTDLWVAKQFYANGEFYWNNNAAVRVIYWLFARIHFLYLLAFIVTIGFATIKQNAELRKRATYLLLCLVLAPGIAVNVFFKDNTLGRPRPVHIQQFGGDHHFTPVFYYSGACKKNCSFVSGHAAIGFFFMALAWALNRKYWLSIGIASGLAVGFVRIIQGGHFLSDVLFAGWFTYWIYFFIAKLFKFTLSNSHAQSKIANT